jgi:hypothetical protein
MGIRIEVSLNGARVAIAFAKNQSQLSKISDYGVTVTTYANPVTGEEVSGHVYMIEEHDREQSVWKLVEKIAAEAARREGSC